MQKPILGATRANGQRGQDFTGTCKNKLKICPVFRFAANWEEGKRSRGPLRREEMDVAKGWENTWLCRYC